MKLRSAIGWLACSLGLGFAVSNLVLSNDAPAVPADSAATREMLDATHDNGAIRVAPRTEPRSAQPQTGQPNPAEPKSAQPKPARLKTAQPQIDVSAARAATGNPLAAIALAGLIDTRERPIFTPSRRPPPPPMVEAPVTRAIAPVVRKPEKPKTPQLSLVGTVISGSESIGLFADPGTKTILRLKTGEGYDGWTLRSVEGREATLATDSAAAILALPAPGTDQAAEPRTVEQQSAPQRSVEQTTAEPPPATSTDDDPPPRRKREPRPKRVHH